MHIDITEEHVSWAARLAGRVAYRWPTIDEQQIASDTNYGLVMAQHTYTPALGPFKPWAYRKMRTYVWNGIRAELNRRRLLQPASIEIYRDDPQHPSPVDIPPELFVDPAALFERRDTLAIVLERLRDESPLTCEAVLDTMPGHAIADKYHVTAAAVSQAKKRFRVKLKKEGIRAY